jgi:hypothetical protein
MQRKKWILLIFFAYIMVFEGYNLAVQGVSAYNWYTSDQYGRDYAELVNEHAMEWRSDMYFQELCDALPDDPVVLETIITRGWVYTSDPDEYLMIDNCPHLYEVVYEIGYNKVRFRGDCSTRAVLFANILNCKGIPYTVKVPKSYLSAMGHVYIDYEGRVTVERDTGYNTTSKRIEWNATYVDNNGKIKNISFAPADKYDEEWYDLTSVDDEPIQNEVIRQSVIYLGLLGVITLGVNSDKVYQKLKEKMKGRRIRIKFEYRRE